MAYSRARQIALAEQGRDLLEQKRTALLREFLRVADRVMAESDARQRAAMATRSELTLEVRAANVMGVNVPAIEQKRVARSALAQRGDS